MSQKELAILDQQLAALEASDAHQPLPLKAWLAAVEALQLGSHRLAPKKWWREKHKAGANPLQAVQAAERYDRLRRDREANAPTLAAIEARLGLPCSNQSKEAQGA